MKKISLFLSLFLSLEISLYAQTYYINGTTDTSLGNRPLIHNNELKIGNSTSATERAKNVIKMGDGSYIQMGEWEADNLLSFKASKYNFTNGNVGIGTTAPQYKLDVSGTAKANALIVNSISGNSSNKMLKIQTDSGYVQIGPQNTYHAHFSTDRTAFYFNKPIAIETGKIVAGSSNFSFDTNGGTRMTILNSNGNVGIGGGQPQFPLDILSTTPNTMKAALARLSEGTNTYLGIKSYDSQPTHCKMFSIEHMFYNTLNGAINFWRGNDMYDGFITISIRGTDLCRFDHQKLNVYGTVFAKEIKVTATGSADFVFNDDYHLRPLSEVNSFIKANKHLPEIPSATEVKEGEGVNLGEMQVKLLQKIEELTLYLIEQDNTIRELKDKIEKLENK
jgi:hypothetical protein